MKGRMSCLVAPILHKTMNLFHKFEIVKSSRNKKELNDITAAPFSVFFCSWQLRKRHRKRGSCDVIKVLDDFRDIVSNIINMEAYKKPPKASRKPQGSYKNFQGRNPYNIFFAILEN